MTWVYDRQRSYVVCLRRLGVSWHGSAFAFVRNHEAHNFKRIKASIGNSNTRARTATLTAHTFLMAAAVREKRRETPQEIMGTVHWNRTQLLV